MASENGTMKTLGWIGGTVVAVLGISFTVYSTFHVPLAEADSKLAYELTLETKCRMENDSILQGKIQQSCIEAKQDLADIKLMIAEIRADLKYLKKDNGRSTN